MFEELFISKKQKLIEKNLRKLGYHLKLEPTFHRGWSQVVMKQYPEIKGLYKGRDFHLTMRTIKRNKKRVFITRVTIGLYNHYQYDLRLSKESFFTKVGKFFGVKDIEVGHPPFDDAYRIQSDDTYFPQEILGKDDVVRKFTDLSNQIKGQFVLEGHELYYEEMIGLVDSCNMKHIRLMISLCHQLCRHIEAFAEDRRPMKGEGGRLKDV